MYIFHETSMHTIKRDRNLLWRNNLHGNRLLVCIQVEVLYPRPPVPRVCILVFAVILVVALPPFAGQYGVELACGGRGFGACFFFLLGFRVEAGEEVADYKVGDQWLQDTSISALSCGKVVVMRWKTTWERAGVVEGVLLRLP